MTRHEARFAAAKVSSGTQAERDFVTLTLGRERYAIDIGAVREIRRYELLLVDIVKPPASEEAALSCCAVE
jgi:chemotaxis signal transduction protein